MTISSTFPGYTPVPGVAVRPVQYDGTVGITVDVSPAGYGLIGWVADNCYKVAVLPSRDELFIDNYVDVTDERILWDGAVEGRTIRKGTLTMIDGELYLAIVSTSGGSPANGSVHIWVADDADNPTTATAHGTVRSFTTTNHGSTQTSDMGQITIAPDGSWLLPAPYPANVTSTVSWGAAMYRSTTAGTTWTTAFSELNLQMGPLSPMIGQDPVTGYLYWTYRDGALSSQCPIMESQNNGASWASNGNDLLYHYYTDDDTGIIYAAAAETTPNLHRAYEFTDPSTHTSTGVAIIDKNVSTDFYFKPLGTDMYAIINREWIVAGTLGLGTWRFNVHWTT